MPTVTGRATDYITFSRASNATVTDSNGYIKWAAHNLLTNSESFDASAWVKAGSTITANAISSPNGTNTADLITEDSANSAHRVLQVATTFPSPTSFGIYAKPNGRSWIYVRADDATSNRHIWFDITNGIVGTAETGFTGTITSIGNGWYYCVATLAAPANGANNIIFGISNADNVTIYTGGGTAGVYLWGAHLYRSDLGGMVANTSAYPYYNPTTPKNLLGYTAFTSGWFVENSAVITPNFTTAPDGLNTAASFSLAANALSNVYQSVSGTGSRTMSAWMKGAVGGEKARFALYNATDGFVASTVINLTTEWVRYSWTATASANSSWYIGNGDATARTIYAWGAQLSDSASLDTYVPNYFAAPTAAAYYGPRLDYDPSTLAAKGLLVEEQRTNLVTYSDSTVANLGASSDVTNASSAIATYFSSSIQFGDNSILRYAYKSITATAASYAFSVYVRMDDNSTPVVGITNSSGDFSIVFDNNPATSGIATTNVGGNVYRITVIGTGSASAGRNYGIIKYTTQSSKGFRVTGYQLEAGSFATSYIPTGSATVTRSADVAQVSTQAFPYSQTEGTLVVNYSIGFLPNIANFYGRIASLSSSLTNLTDLFINGGFGPRTAALMVSDGVSQFDITLTPNLSATTTEKVAIAYQVGNTGVVKAGGTVSTPTVSALPTNIPQLMIANSPEGRRLNGHIRQITYLPRRITNAELQTRTS